MGIFDRFTAFSQRPNFFDRGWGQQPPEQQQPPVYGQPGGPVPPWGQPGGMKPPQQRQPQAPMPQPAPQQQQQQQPPMFDMGQQAMPMNHADPQSLVQRQPQPGEAAQKEKGFLGRLGDSLYQGMENFGAGNLTQLGLSVLAGSQNSDWSPAAQAMGQINDRQLQEKQLKKEDERWAKTFGLQEAANTRAEAEAKAAADERDRINKVREATVGVAKEMEASLPQDADPIIRSMLRFAQQQPDAFPDALNMQYQMAKENRDEKRAIALEDLKGAWDMRAAQARASNDAASQNNILERQQQLLGIKQNMDKLGESFGAAQMAQNAMGAMDEYASLIKQLGDLGGMQNPFDAKLQDLYANAVKGNRATEAKAIREKMSRLQGKLVSDFVQAIKPVSNADFQWAQSITPNSNWTVRGALDAINSERTKLAYDLSVYNQSVDWTKQGRNIITDRDPQTGKTLLETIGPRPYIDWESFRTPGGASSAPMAPGMAAGPRIVDSMPSPADVPEGATVTNTETGQRWKKMNGQLVPAGREGRGGSVDRR